MLIVNVQTSMVGGAWFEMREQGNTGGPTSAAADTHAQCHPIPGFVCADSDFLIGNYIGKPASWGGGKRRSLGLVAGKLVGVRVAMNDAVYIFMDTRYITCVQINTANSY